jgi:hypothetical protein
MALARAFNSKQTEAPTQGLALRSGDWSSR